MFLEQGDMVQPDLPYRMPVPDAGDAVRSPSLDRTHAVDELVFELQRVLGVETDGLEGGQPCLADIKEQGTLEGTEPAELAAVPEPNPVDLGLRFPPVDEGPVV